MQTDNSGRGCLETLPATSTARVMPSTPTPSGKCTPPSAEGGREAIDKVMRTQPAAYLKMLALLVPREMKVEHSGGVKAMTDEQLEQGIEAIQAMLAARAGEAAKVIEGTAEPAALPAPEAQSIGAGLEPKRQRRPSRLIMQADTAVGSRERISRGVPPPSRA